LLSAAAESIDWLRDFFEFELTRRVPGVFVKAVEKVRSLTSA
jgi:hypothetical protein